MSIEDMFGDLKLIDIMYETTDGAVVLELVCNGFIDGSPKTQTALLDKMEGYLKHIQSDQFKGEYPNKRVILSVTFTEKPDPLITDLLYQCQKWITENGATLEIKIDHKLIKFQVS